MIKSDHSSDDPFGHWLLNARAGCDEAVSRCLESYRGYLSACAARELPAELRVKASVSDLVQESMLEAFQGFSKFRGNTREEFAGWLRQILCFNATDVARRFSQTTKRDLHRERPLVQIQSDIDFAAELTASGASPSSLVGQSEEECRVLKALSQLPLDYRRVIELRNLQGLSFAIIGQQMGRSSDAARKLWARAIEHLARGLSHDDSSS